MNISDLNNFSIDSNAAKISIIIEDGFIMYGQTSTSKLSIYEARELFERLAILENNVFFDPKNGVYYKGDKNYIGSTKVIVFDLVDITEIYNRYKQAKTDFEVYQLDALTHLPSRNKLDSDLLGYLSHVIKNNDEFAMLMCDIDHFKNFNDTYGHVFGDRVLAKVADVLKLSIRTDEIRRKDIIGRFGGEEFLIVLKDVTKEQSFLLAERIRKNVEQATIDEVGVTISIGLFHSDDMIKSNEKFNISKELLIELREKMVTCADTALYVSKASGRNRSTMYDYTMNKEVDDNNIESGTAYCLKKLPPVKSNS